MPFFKYLFVFLIANTSNMNQSPGNDYSFLKIIYTRRVFILVITTLAIIGASIFSGPTFIQPRYQSEVILYPPSTNSNRMLIERDARFGRVALAGRTAELGPVFRCQGDRQKEGAAGH